MTAHFSPKRAHRATHTDSQIGAIRAFFVDNRNELTRIVRVVAGEIAAANVAILAGLLKRSRPPVQRILEVLAEVRDALAEAGADTGHAESREDLDAAIRWHGARLDDLLRASNY